MAIGGNTALGPSRDSDQLVGGAPLARAGPPIVAARATCLPVVPSPMSVAAAEPYVTTQSGRQQQAAGFARRTG